MPAPTTSPARRAGWRVATLLILLSLVPTAAGTARLAQLARGATITVENARFFASPLPVVLHVLAVIPFSLLGALQFVPAFRRLHRGRRSSIRGRRATALALTGG